MRHTSIEYLSKLFNKTPEEIEKVIGPYDYVRFATDQKIQDSLRIIEKYIALPNLSQEENQARIMQYAFENINLLGTKASTLEENFSYYQKEFALTNGEFYKKRKSKICNTPGRTCEELIDFLQKRLSINRNSAKIIIKNNFSILSMGTAGFDKTEDAQNNNENVSSIITNINYLQTLLNCDNETLAKIYKNNSRLICYSPSAISSIFNNIKSSLKISDTQTRDLICRFSRITTIKQCDLIPMIDYLEMLGFTKEDMYKTPFLLSSDKKTIKAKFMLGRIWNLSLANKDIFINNFHTSYAKLNTILDVRLRTGEDIPFEYVGRNENEFYKKTKTTVAEACSNYSVNEATLVELEAKYKKLQIQNPELPKLDLTNEDIKNVISQLPPALRNVNDNYPTAKETACEATTTKTTIDDNPVF